MATILITGQMTIVCRYCGRIIGKKLCLAQMAGHLEHGECKKCSSALKKQKEEIRDQRNKCDNAAADDGRAS